MNVRHFMGVVHSFFTKNIIHDRTDLSFFYFHVTMCTTKNIKKIVLISWKVTLREKCLYSESFWSIFSHFRTENGEIVRISPYLFRIQENTDQNNSEYEHFLCSVKV